MNFTDSHTEATNSTTENEMNWGTVIVCFKTVTGILLASSIYITGALIVYGVKNNKFKRQSEADFTGGVVYMMPITASFFCCLRLFWSLVGEEIFSLYQEGKDVECDIYNTAHAVMLTSVLLMTYMVLYVRQKVLYDHPMWASSLSNSIILLSRYSGLLIVALVLGTLVLRLLTPVERKSYRFGCLSTINSKGQVMFGVVFAVMLIIQVLTLTLFIVPLSHARSHNKSMRRFTMKSKSTLSNTSPSKHAKKAPRQKSILQRSLSKLSKKKKCVDEATSILKRSLAAAVACTVTDTIAFASVSIISDAYPIIIKVFFWDVTLWVNVFCLLVSFKKWRHVLFITKCVKSKPEESPEPSSGALASITGSLEGF